MKIAEINTVNYGSTGRIMLGIQQVAKKSDIEVYTYFALGNKDKQDAFSKKVGMSFFNKISSKLAHITGMMGCFSFFSTMHLIADLKKKKIDLIHLHNIHISFLNYPMLFRFIKKSGCRVVWTLHDCWAFTGHCPHFEYEHCEKWREGCHNCPKYKEYPASTFDNSKFMYKLKKRTFTGVKDLIIVTPSEWLKRLVKQSFLGNYDVKVINNGVDVEEFYPIQSDFRDRYNLKNKFIILGVAFDWGKKKGLDVFLELHKRLDHEKIQIVLVGTDEKIDSNLPEGMLSIHKTDSCQDLAKIYTAADVFLNPTREEVLGLVNVEANACGTPVIMFNTGGSPECINEKSGIVVDLDDIDAMEQRIIHLQKFGGFSTEDCVLQSRKFNKYDKYAEYLDLYRNLCRN